MNQCASLDQHLIGGFPCGTTVTPIRSPDTDRHLGESLFHKGPAARPKRRNLVKPKLAIAQPCSLLGDGGTRGKG